jgi:hypothetical protein
VDGGRGAFDIGLSTDSTICRARARNSAWTLALATRSRAKGIARRTSPAAAHASAARSSHSANEVIDIANAPARSAITRAGSRPVISDSRARR